MLHRCELCVLTQHNNASKLTDDLTLRTINGRDYLVCEIHRGNHGKPEENSERIIPIVPKSVQ